MKVRDLLKSIRQTAAADRILIPGRGGRKNRAWPVCMTCGREPYSVQLEDVGKNSVEVRVKCGHKPYHLMADNDMVYEDSARIEIPFGTERVEHLNWALQHQRWFDPTTPPK